MLDKNIPKMCRCGVLAGRGQLVARGRIGIATSIAIGLKRVAGRLGWSRGHGNEEGEVRLKQKLNHCNGIA